MRGAGAVNITSFGDEGARRGSERRLARRRNGSPVRHSRETVPFDHRDPRVFERRGLAPPGSGRIARSARPEIASGGTRIVCDEGD